MTVKQLLILFITGLFASCSTGPDLAGSGSESSNALTGTVLWHPSNDSTVKLAVNATVTLYKIIDTVYPGTGGTYTEKQAGAALTDNNGNFRINGLAAGTYSMVFEQGNQKCFSGYFSYRADDTPLDFGYLTLNPTQTLRGTIRDTTATRASLLVLSLVGTAYSDTADTSGAFAFTAIPLGKYYLSVRGVLINGLPGSTDVATTVLVSDTLRPGIASMQSSLPYNDFLAVLSGDSADNSTIMPNISGSIIHQSDTVSIATGDFLIKYTQESNNNQ